MDLVDELPNVDRTLAKNLQKFGHINAELFEVEAPPIPPSAGKLMGLFLG